MDANLGVAQHFPFALDHHAKPCLPPTRPFLGFLHVKYLSAEL